MIKDKAIITKFLYRASKFYRSWPYPRFYLLGYSRLHPLRTSWIILAVGLLLFAGCSDLKFQARHQDLPVADIIGLKEQVKATGRVSFYFAGLYPSSQTIWVDQELRNRSNLKYLSAVQIKHYRTWPDWLIAVFTLGIYVPLHYEITAKGVDYDLYR